MKSERGLAPAAAKKVRSRRGRSCAKSSCRRRRRQVPSTSGCCEIARKLPGVEESSSYGTPALKVKGRFMCRLRSEAEGALAIRCDFLDRQILLQADPEVFFVTDHYLELSDGSRAARQDPS